MPLKTLLIVEGSDWSAQQARSAKEQLNEKMNLVSFKPICLSVLFHSTLTMKRDTQ